MAGVALGHHVGWFKDSACDFGNRQRLVHCLVRADDWRIRGQHEVDAGVRHQVGLELGDVDVQGPIESERGGQTGNDLGDQAIEVSVRWLGNVQVTSANVIQSLVVKAEGTIGVFQKSMGGKDGVVGLYDSSGHLRTGRDGKRELGFASIVNRETFQ